MEFDKISLVNKLAKYGTVYISSEVPLEKALEKYRFPLPYYDMHNALAFASLFFGESATMASESAVLGVPAVFFDTQGRCYTKEEEEKYSLVFRFNPTADGIDKGINKAISLLTGKNTKEIWATNRASLLHNSINPTPFLLRFIENYPQSAILK